jgi:DNA polymerase-3 subunit alpha
MAFPASLQASVDASRLVSVDDTAFFNMEVDLLRNSRVVKYYQHIIDNVDLNPSNLSNSYLMWVAGKVSTIDLSKPPVITQGRIALPDIDTDFPIKFREKVKEYIREKYGHAHVCDMATFSRMQGRGALKDVLRVHSRCGFEEMNLITEHIPDEAEIADQLQEMKEETGEASIIQWALENNAEALKPWVFIKEDGELDGPLAMDFAQAIRLEGTKRSMGKHASGLIICSETLADIAPMVYDRGSQEMMLGIDMRDGEAMGLVKFDILGLRCLDCLEDCENIIRTGSHRKKDI